MCSKAISEQERYDELACYTLAHPDPGFIHQNIVDAFGAQTATEADKPIKIAFALVGLYTTAHGAVGLPAGAEAGLWRRPRWLAEVLCKAG